MFKQGGIMEPKKKLPIHIKLKQPIETGEGDENGQLKEIVISREPTGADWAQFNIANPTIQDYLRVASKLTNIPLPILKRVDTAATFRLVEVLSDFLE